MKKAWSSSGLFCSSFGRVVQSRSQKTSRKIPLYDFQRYQKVYNNNKPLRFPVDDMEVTFFVRPECHETDAEVLEQQLKQKRFPISEISNYLPEYIKSGGACFSSVSDIRTEDDTMHGQATFLGLTRHEENGKIERYLLKFFPTNSLQQKNARREVLFSYLFVEAGEALHAPKITLNKIAGHVCVLRRFYKGTDGRMILENEIPADLLTQLRPKSLVKYYALRYALLGDIDFHNPGNVIFTRHSELTPKVLLHIDGEGILPDAESMTQFLDADAQTKDMPIPGSLEWRQMTSRNIGGEEFFNRMCESDNTLLAFLRLGHSPSEMARLELCNDFMSRILAARPYFEQLIRTFDILPLDVLQSGVADFQQTLDKWEEYYNTKKPITLFHLVTGLY